MIRRLFASPEGDCAWAQTIAESLSLPLERASKEDLVARVKAMPLEEKFSWSKSTLFLTKQKGKFLKKCPGSAGVLCCNYYTINTVSGCPFDCSYCILQGYIENNPFITVFTNREDMIPEIATHLKHHKKLRVGTGELADSLALDPLLGETAFFLEMIHKQAWEERVTIEFKTKSAEIDVLLEARQRFPSVDVVAGFSVNIPSFTRSDEHGTAALEKRLSAMRVLQQHNIPIALHFDPLVMVEGFLPQYQALVRELFTGLDHRLIRWISLGGYRHTVSLAPTIERRFARSLLLAGEMFPSESDHKFRYFHPIRREFYRAIIRDIRGSFPSAPLYLCMEKPFLWEETGLEVSSCSECFGAN